MLGLVTLFLGTGAVVLVESLLLEKQEREEAQSQGDKSNREVGEGAIQDVLGYSFGRHTEESHKSSAEVVSDDNSVSVLKRQFRGKSEDAVLVDSISSVQHNDRDDCETEEESEPWKYESVVP